MAAESAADALFAGGANSENIPSVQIDMDAPMGILDFLVAIKMFDSKSEARRMVQQGGIQIDGERVADWQSEIAPRDEIMVQRGKKVFLRVIKRN